MYNKQVGLNNSYASQIKKAVDKVYIFEWNQENGITWISDCKNDILSAAFVLDGGAESAVKKGVLHEDDIDEMKDLKNIKDSNKIYLERVLRLKMETDDYIWYKVSINNFYDTKGTCIRFIMTALDIQDIVSDYKNMQYRIEFDALTNIYNADKFYQLVSDNIHKNPEKNYALIRIDIDRFKVINDMFGVEEGNKLLRYIANIIKMCYQPGYLYCRINSDIFCLCITYDNKQEIVALVKWIEEQLELYDMNYKIVPAFGIYRIEDPDVPVSVMLDWAKLASKSIKGSLFSNYAFYNNALRSKILNEIEIEGCMKEALFNHEFKVYLQPKYDISTSNIVGAEVLCRWLHPTKGFLAPVSFIPLFEKNGFIIQLDYYMWEETCKLIRKWLDEGKNVMTISINVSRMHVYNAMFEKQIVQLMDKYQIPPNLVELELTESAFMENESEIYQIMERLKNKGFLFSIDDFGSGYSSLNMLKSVPIDIVKLDRGFLNEISASRKGREIIRYTIAMARQLNLKVIAEGVETVEQAAFLLETGCNTAQGYYYCRPIPTDEFEKLAFEKYNVKKPDVSIQSVVHDKKVMMDDIRKIQDSDVLQGFFNTSAFTYDEMNNIQNNFVKILKKYRAIIFATNVVFFEFDLERDKVIASYQAEGFEPVKPIKNYKELVKFLTDNCNPEDKAMLKKILSLQNLQNMLDGKKSKAVFDYRLHTAKKDEVWMRSTIVLDADKNGIIDTLLFSSTDIDELKR